MNLTPLHDRIIVRAKDRETVTSSGLFLPAVAQEKQMIGVILAVGAGETDERGRFRPTELRAGLVVLFGKFVGTEYEHEGEKILFMRESDVLAVVGTEAEEAESL